MRRYVGETVIHERLGKGEIISQDENSITVSFSGRTSGFLFPKCFDKYLRFLNQELQEEIRPEAEKNVNLNSAVLNKVQSDVFNSTKIGTRDGGSRRNRSEISQLTIPRYTSFIQFSEDQKQLISAEIKKIKEGSEKTYRVHDGVLVDSHARRFYYAFESDDELFIPDDTEIYIITSTGGIKAKAIHCEDFTVTISCAEFLGKTVTSLRFRSDPWQLLQALIDRLEEMQINHSQIAEDLVMNGRSNIDSRKGITCGQDNAVDMACNQPITMIWGPPGTGKTEVLARIAVENMRRGDRVLMLSYSNVSVDGAMWRVFKKSKGFQPGSILRYGYPRDKGLLDHECLTSYRYVLNDHPSLQSEREQLQNEKRKVDKKSRRRVEIDERLKRIRDLLAQEEKEAVRNAQFVATTVSKAVVDSTLYEHRFDTVIFDEASMAYIPQIVFSSNLAKKHFVCMGDFNQLPPIVQHSDTCNLNIDIFTYCGIQEAVMKHFGHNWLCLLNIQHRMHPLIAKFAGDNMYSGLLRSADDMETNRKDIVEADPFSGNPINIVDLSDMLSVCLKSRDGSHYNILSAMICMCLAARAAENHEVGIVAPYHAQSRLTHAMARDLKDAFPDLKPISCATVHQFQGSEKSVILFDAVDCYRQQYPGILLTSRKNNYADRLYNVALTRAQGKMISVANLDYFEEKNLQRDLLLSTMIRNYQAKAKIYGMDLLRDLNSTYIHAGDSESMQEEFFSDIDSMHNYIMIDIPDRAKIEEDKQFHDFLCHVKSSLYRNSCVLIVRSENKASLPEVFRNIANESYKAINPITIIDGTIVWYGMPICKTGFQTENGPIKTRFLPAIRFKGKSFARTISGLLEMDRSKEEAFDYDLDIPGYIPPKKKQEEDITRSKPKQVQTNGNGTTSFTMPGVSKKPSGYRYGTFKTYIWDEKKCKCGNRRFLSQNAGKYVLKCSDKNCGKEEPVTEKMVNTYIEKYAAGRFICKHDKSSIRAKMRDGKLVVQCDGFSTINPETGKKVIHVHRYDLETI